MMDTKSYDLSAPWNQKVKGTQVLPLINDDASIMRVEAGPGTGKTFGLVQRIVRILHPNGLNCLGSKVAVVAFNRVIAKQLGVDIKKALKDLPHDQMPVIHTVHGFCLRLVGGGDIRILLPHEREAMIYDILHEHSQLNSDFPNHGEAEQALHDHEAGIRQWPTLWQAALRWLTRHRAKLISDLPRLLIDRIKGGDFTDSQFEHVIVDEFQDLTPAQQELFLKLRTPQGQLVALGDPRQSIYAFLGNERKGLAKLSDHPLLAQIPIQDCPMTECQRCPKEIVLAANKLMSLSGAMPMIPANNTPATVRVTYWKTPISEAKGMAKFIKQQIRSSPKDHKHLVMVTRRQFGYWLRDELVKLDSSICVELSFSESILELWPVREAFLFFCLLADPDAPTWRAWLGYRMPSASQNHLSPDRNAPAYLNFLTQCTDSINAEAILKLCDEPQSRRRGQGGSALWERACRFRDLLQAKQWKQMDTKAVIEAVFVSNMWVRDDNTTANEDLKILCESAIQILDDLASGSESKEHDDKLRQIARQLRYSISTREPLNTRSEATLKVTTLWGAKGLTSHHVYVLGLCKEAIPGMRTAEYPGTDSNYDEEQRRLFYVTITRARETLVLSRPKKVKYGDAKKLNLQVASSIGHHSDLEMCPFLRDIMDTLPDAVDGEILVANTESEEE